MSDHLHTPVALPSEEKLQYRLKRMLGDGRFKTVEKYFFSFSNRTKFYPIGLPQSEMAWILFPPL